MKKIANEIKEKNFKELGKEIALLREEIGKLKLEAKVNPQKDSNAIFKKRKRLAVLLTVLAQRKEIKG